MKPFVMRPIMVSALLCLAITAGPAAGQTSKYGVKVDAEKNVDFSKFKTYSWVAGQPSADKTINSQITAAVDRELTGLGMTQAASGSGDVSVTYYSLTRTDVDLKAKADAKGISPQYTVGSLMVALLEKGTGRRLLRLRADKKISAEPAKLEAAINEAVTEMFQKYPTRTQK